MATRERKKIVVTIRKKAEKQQPPPLASSQQPSLASTDHAGHRLREEDAASGNSSASPRLRDDGSSNQRWRLVVGAATATDDEDETLASEPRRTHQVPRQGQQHLHDQRPPKRQRRRGQGGLPSFSVRYLHSSQHEKGLSSALDVDKDEAAANDFDNDEEVELPCETMMVLTSLLSDPSKRVAVPILGSGGQNVFGASPLHLYAALDGRDPVVMGELRTLLHSDVVCKLRLPPQHVGALSSSSSRSGGAPAPRVAVSDPHHHLLMLKSEYRRAAYQSVLPELDPVSSSLLEGLGSRNEAAAAQLQHIVEWFLDESNVVDTISEQELEERLRKQATRCLPAAAIVLSKLQGLQLLRSLPAPSPNQGRTVFQLWLPSWGLVARAWDKAATNLVAHLRRSQYKERSHQSLVAPQRNNRSPIPADLVVEHLVSQGIVAKVERPAGTFVRVVGH